MQLLCPACCSEEVGPHPDPKSAELRCANCGEGCDRAEAHVTVAEAESRLSDPVPEELFVLDAARARSELRDPGGAIGVVDPYVGADELHRLLDAAQAKDVIRARRQGATIAVHPYSVAEPDPLVAVRLDRGPTLTGSEPDFRPDEDEGPVAYTVRLLGDVVARANVLVAGRAADSGRLDRIAAFMNANRPWSAGDVCRLVASEIVASGRRLDAILETVGGGCLARRPGRSRRGYAPRGDDPMDDATIRRAGDALIDAVAAPARVVVIEQSGGGGHLFLVVVDRIDGRIAEMARLDTLLRRMLIPADVAVVTEAEMGRRHDLGAVIREVTIRSRIIGES